MLSPEPGATTYPAAPWAMTGSLWLSLFRVREDVDDLRPAGVYGAAFVSYEPGSVLTYSELLVARPVPDPAGGHGRRVSITDIWVDSPASMAGGRELWAIPKGLCDFELDSSHRGPLSTHGVVRHARATSDRPRHVHRRVARRGHACRSRAAPGSPAGAGRGAGGGDPAGLGEDRCPAGAAGSSPPTARWACSPATAAWASFRMAAFRMSFG